jgi:parvulin-like peptidyl-prolyl isomerase
MLLLLLAVAVLPAYSFWGEDYLVKVNDQPFSKDDYQSWWSEWQDPGMAVHDSVDEFVDFMLLSQEAADMQLSDSPSYKKKLDVFLRVRALMQLKAEEVDALKVIPPREELWDAYVEKYTPVLDLTMIAVQDEEQANAIAQFQEQGVDFAQLTEAAGLGKVAEQMEATGPMRHTRFPEPLREVVITLQPGDVAGPVKYGHSWYFMKVVDRQDGTDADFESLKQNIIRDKLKQQEYELTQNLIAQLMGEYDVTIDEEVIGRIGPDGPAEGDGEKIVLIMGDVKIPASFISASVNKTQQTRGVARLDPENFEESKQRIVNDYLVQTLTEKAALDRHYEQVMPLKSVYDFYRKYRLIKEFEEQIIKPQVAVTDADVEKHYQENTKHFMQQGMVEYSVVSTNETSLAKITQQKLKSGADFFTIMQPLSPAGVKIEKSLPEQLPAAIKEELLEMAPGQVKTIVNGENTHFVKLIRSAEDKVVPFENVKTMIVKSLEKTKFEELRAGYVAQLRERSNIKVNKNAWKLLREQLLKENAS